MLTYYEYAALSKTPHALADGLRLVFNTLLLYPVPDRTGRAASGGPAAGGRCADGILGRRRGCRGMIFSRRRGALEQGTQLGGDRLDRYDQNHRGGNPLNPGGDNFRGLARHGLGGYSQNGVDLIHRQAEQHGAHGDRQEIDRRRAFAEDVDEHGQCGHVGGGAGQQKHQGGAGADPLQDQGRCDRSRCGGADVEGRCPRPA